MEYDSLSLGHSRDSTSEQTPHIFRADALYRIRGRANTEHITPESQIPPDPTDLQHLVEAQRASGVLGEKLVVGSKQEIVAVHMREQKEAWCGRVCGFSA